MRASTTDEDRWAALVSREARGETLTCEEDDFRRRFEDRHPETSGERGLWEALGALGDPRGGEAEMSDEAMLERVLSSHRAAFVRPRSKPLLRRSVAGGFAAIALAAALVLAVAAELVGPFGSPAPGEDKKLDGIEEAPKNHALPPPPLDVDVAVDADAGVDAAEAREDAQEAESPLNSLEPGEPKRIEAPSKEGRGNPASESADDLLKSAQIHLGEGRTASAIEAYKKLLARYPGSVEARVALVSLGQLSLGGGDAAGALRYFERYLAGSGPLGMEARLGRIQALRRLGRTGDELAAIHDFLARHPDSVHAPRLRSRIEAPPSK